MKKIITPSVDIQTVKVTKDNLKTEKKYPLHVKTSTNQKANMKDSLVVQGIYTLDDMNKRYSVGYKSGMDDCHAYLDEAGVNNDKGIDVPLHARGGEWKWNFEKRMPLVDKITWVLTAVNVAILITLVIKNV